MEEFDRVNERVKDSINAAFNYYKDNFNVQMAPDEYEDILSILEDKSYYKTKL